MRINGKAFAHLMATTKAPGPVSLIIGHTFAVGIHVGIFLWLTSGWPAAVDDERLQRPFRRPPFVTFPRLALA